MAVNVNSSGSNGFKDRAKLIKEFVRVKETPTNALNDELSPISRTKATKDSLVLLN